MKKLTDRQKQAISTKLRITQISMDLFKKKGFENVKIQDICDEAQISTGAFYHHFKSKNEIINTGYEQIDILLQERFLSQTFNSNVEKIIFLLSEGCVILQDLGWIFVCDVYKNLLSVDGKYSLKPDRFVAIEIKSALDMAIISNELKFDISSTDLTKTILRISRGAIFDWCLHEGSFDLKTTTVSDLSLLLANYKTQVM